MTADKEWFELWFDSPYYHILYDHRDENEAEGFILELKKHLDLNGQERVLDLACGAGRHAAFISNYVHEAVGLDLSENSIQQAKSTYPSENLEFYTHDMRLPFRINYFDYIFNFFTSFGYFKRKSDNLKVLQSIYKGLQPKGKIVLDFMNANKAIQNLKASEVITKQGITFNIRRIVEDGIIKKNIAFTADGKNYNYTESVQALLPKDFNYLMKAAGFTILDTFGGYALQPYDSINSNRFIIIGQK